MSRLVTEPPSLVTWIQEAGITGQLLHGVTPYSPALRSGDTRGCEPNKHVAKSPVIDDNLTSLVHSARDVSEYLEVT